MKSVWLFSLLFALALTCEVNEQATEIVGGYVDDATHWAQEYRRSLPRFTLHVLKTGSAHWPAEAVPAVFDPQNLDYIESITYIALYGLIPALVFLCIGPVICIGSCCCCGKAKDDEAITQYMQGTIEFEPSRVSRVKRVMICIVVGCIWILLIFGWVGNGIFGARMSTFMTTVNTTAYALDKYSEETASMLTQLSKDSYVPELGAVSDILSFGDKARTGLMPMMNELNDGESYRLVILHLTLLATLVITIPACMGQCCPKFWKYCFFAWIIVCCSYTVMLLLIVNFGVHFAFSVPMVDMCPSVDMYMATGNLTTEMTSLLVCGGANLTAPHTALLNQLQYNATQTLASSQARYDADQCATTRTAECATLLSIIEFQKRLIANSEKAKVKVDYITNCNITRAAIPTIQEAICTSLVGWVDEICVVELLLATLMFLFFIPLHILIERSFHARRPQFNASTFLPFRKPAGAKGGRGAGEAEMGTKDGNELVGAKFSRSTHVKLDG
ncbi:hypothetical protein PAPYR_2958 [Paratrimastix pyriformis]|uniref:Uncharacterized protein n=1 Tax=Paratrimastix pyriformis TaxID=342808 RepID=A0ABQ8UVE5_9EUKA|nr:hypothetical protein PAPYR_2958 [Paratrimastix pyriformis]|eukprot:GAFH01001267.1.p1 GENE.GAFH01001267.1~~GAFH01001267.1.p1  ORF type:complete len:503 (+),score=158.27 GAFH01001267.1:36-1544(+)